MLTVTHIAIADHLVAVIEIASRRQPSPNDPIATSLPSLNKNARCCA
jgi:hypothetical protein